MSIYLEFCQITPDRFQSGLQLFAIVGVNYSTKHILARFSYMKWHFAILNCCHSSQLFLFTFKLFGIFEGRTHVPFEESKFLWIMSITIFPLCCTLKYCRVLYHISFLGNRCLFFFQDEFHHLFGVVDRIRRSTSEE